MLKLSHFWNFSPFSKWKMGYKYAGDIKCAMRLLSWENITKAYPGTPWIPIHVLKSPDRFTRAKCIIWEISKWRTSPITKHYWLQTILRITNYGLLGYQSFLPNQILIGDRECTQVAPSLWPLLVPFIPMTNTPESCYISLSQ